MVNPTKLETIEQVIGDYDVECLGCARGYDRAGAKDEILKASAVALAKKADVVLYFFGLDELSESEGLDRSHMRIPQNQIELLEAIAQVNTNVVGIISAGSSIEMPWHHCCKAILHGYLCGQAGASALLDIVTGKVNPSGRLNETYPLRYEDTPAFRNYPSQQRCSQFRESIYVGYRYYDTSKVRVLFPFGFGLSYTEFTYSDIAVDEKGVHFTITNVGKYDGAEVAQLYIGMRDSKIFRADKELKGFKKVFLKAGESRQVTIPFDDKTFRYWNTATNSWEKEAGTYEIMVGTSVADIRLIESLSVNGTTEQNPYQPEMLPSYYSGLIQDVTEEEFAVLYGRTLPDGKWSGELTINDAICQMYYAKSGLARLIYKVLTSIKTKSEAKGTPNLNILFIYNMPFRGIAKMTNGAVSMYMAEGMVKVVNGHFFKGMGMIIGGFFKNARANKEYEKKLNS